MKAENFYLSKSLWVMLCVSCISCVSLMDSIKIPIKELDGVKQLVLRYDDRNPECESVTLRTTPGGYFDGYDIHSENYRQCVSKPLLFCFEYEDYDALQAFLVRLKDGYDNR